MGNQRYCKSGKISYGNEYKAWAAALWVIKLGILEDAQVYFCPHCRHYHLTTARVQLHDWMWWQSRMEQRKRHPWYDAVQDWFKQRGTIDTWDDK